MSALATCLWWQLLASVIAELQLVLVQMASMTAHWIIDSLLNVLPARMALSVMQRLALYSHLPHITKILPEVKHIPCSYRSYVTPN